MSDLQRYFVARISGQDGPLTAAQVQEGLRSGRYKPSDLSWVELGESEWIPLAERSELSVHTSKPVPAEPLFAEPAAVEPPSERQPSLPSQRPPGMPAELAGRLTPEQWLMAQRAAVAWRRFLARTVDLGIAFILIELAIGADMRHPKVPSLGLSLLTMAIWPWLEALLLSTVGNTPGKALLRLQVINHQGGRPHFLQALTRSVWVWIQGMGLGLPILGAVTQIIAFNRYTRDDRTAWDERAATRIAVRPISRLRMSLIVGLFVGSALLSLLVMAGRV